ncbi:hypothetical protein ACTQ6A_13860 [Lachnospiraceae bacterium LCP25S3_G4]
MTNREARTNLRYIRTCDECTNGMGNCKQCDRTIEMAIQALENQSKLEEQIVRELENFIELIVKEYPFQGRYIKKNCAIDIVRNVFKEREVLHERD